MGWNAVELAAELLERFSLATVDGGEPDGEALAWLLQRYPIGAGTAAGWRAFLDGVSNPHSALPIEAGAAAELRGLLIPFCNAGEEPDREALAQYIGLGFSLYSQCETQDGKRKFCDWRTGKPSKQPQSVIKALAELDTALAAGIMLFSFLPSERGFVCIDVDCGHENGIDGWPSYISFLKAKGIEGDPLSEAKVIVDTPSGGNHLYFLARGDGIRHEAKLCANVEAFGTGSGRPLTAAGSVKKGKAYRLHGRLEDAAVIPRKLNNLLAKDIFAERAAQSSNQGKSRHAASARRGYSSEGREYALAEKVAYYAGKSPKAGRNNTAHYCALRLGWQSSSNELYAAMRAHPELGTLPDGELRAAIQSGMSKSRKL